MTKRRFEELRHEYLVVFAKAVNAQLFNDKRGQRHAQNEVHKYEAFVRVFYGSRSLFYLKRSILRIVKRRMILATSPWLYNWIRLVDNSVDNVDNIKGQSKSESPNRVDNPCKVW